MGAAAEAGEVGADVAVVLLDSEGQILAGKQSFLRDQPLEAFPFIGQEDVALDADLVEKSSAGRIITPTQLPGQGSPPQDRRPARAKPCWLLSGFGVVSPRSGDEGSDQG